MRSGKTLWDELCDRYFAGAAAVDTMLERWDDIQSALDPVIYSSVRAKLKQQQIDAARWRDTCISYFQKFSKRPRRNP
jgi:alpha-glucuronidase